MRRLSSLPLTVLYLMLALPLFQGCGESETDPEAFFKKDYRVIQEMRQNSSALSEQFELTFRNNHVQENAAGGRLHKYLLLVLQKDNVFLLGNLYNLHEAYSMQILIEFKKDSPPLPALYDAFRDHIRQVALPALDVFESHLSGAYRYEGDEATFAAIREAATAYRTHALEVAAFLDGMAETQVATSVHKGIAAEKVFQPVLFGESSKRFAEDRSRGCPPFTGAIDLDATLPPLTLAWIEESAEVARHTLAQLEPLCADLQADPHGKLRSVRCQKAVLEVERYLLYRHSAANMFRLFTLYESNAPEYEALRIFPLFRLAYGSPRMAGGFAFNLCQERFGSDGFIYMPLPENIERIMRDMYARMAQDDMITESLYEYITYTNPDMQAAINDRGRIRDSILREDLPPLKRFLQTLMDSAK